MGASSNVAPPSSRRYEDGLLVDERPLEPDYAAKKPEADHRQVLEMDTISQNVPMTARGMGSAANETELIPAAETVVLDASTARQMHLDMSRLLEQNQLLQTRISQLEQDQRSSANTSTADGRIPVRAGVVALRTWESPEVGEGQVVRPMPERRNPCTCY